MRQVGNPEACGAMETSNSRRETVESQASMRMEALAELAVGKSTDNGDAGDPWDEGGFGGYSGFYDSPDDLGNGGDGQDPGPPTVPGWIR